MVGIMNRIEIWSKTLWDDANEYEGMEDIAEELENLGIIL